MVELASLNMVEVASLNTVELVSLNMVSNYRSDALTIELQRLTWQSEVISVVRCATFKLLCAEMGL